MTSYIAIDLKSFYASVECIERGLDPLTAKLVVADESRTDKTICLAVSPALKKLGIPGRARLYEVKQKAKDFIIAPPRMGYYISYSTRVYNIYLRYIAAEDMHIYSIDEVFIDATPYLKNYKMTARELAGKIMKELYNETGITATAGIGTNLYLAKVAMDIMAKHEEPDENGVRIAELDEMSYRQKLWGHRPLTDFWRVGRGYAKRLEAAGLYTMGDIALCAEKDEDYLYKMFGVNAELLIDHAWGWESVGMKEVKAYRPSSNSFSSGQVLKEPYDYGRAKVVVQEMAEEVGLKLLNMGLVTNQVVLTVGYDVTSLANYRGEVMQDFYGRKVSKHAHGTYNFDEYVASTGMMRKAVLEIKKRYGKNAILKGINFEEGATGRERNQQIGGHRG